MKICILTEGGRDIGFGHVARCVSIYQAFEERDIQPLLIVNGDETVKDLLQNKNYRNFDWLSNRSLLFELLDNPDIAFVDSYLADYQLYEKVSHLAEKTVYLDDNIRINYPKGFVVNGAVFAERMSYTARKGVTYLLGTQYAPLRKEFWNVSAKTVSGHIRTTLITFGGADVRNLTPKVLKLLINTYPRMLKKVIVGKNFQNITEIESLKDNNTELVYCPHSAEVKEVMYGSDVAISAGGQTLYELARMSVPTIVITVADNQIDNIHGWETAGFIEYAGHWQDESLSEVIRQKMQMLESKDARERKCNIARGLIDGVGSPRLVKKILSDFYKPRISFRKVVFEDAGSLFGLANQDIVRENSFTQDKIVWDNHLKWLEGRLKDDNCVFFIVEYNGKFAGQVRFDVIATRKEATINISLGQNIRGLDLSPFIITESVKQLLKVRKDIKLVKAYIKDTNIPSIKGFERAGFKFLADTVAKGYNTKVYVRTTLGEDK